MQSNKDQPTSRFFDLYLLVSLFFQTELDRMNEEYGFLLGERKQKVNDTIYQDRIKFTKLYHEFRQAKNEEEVKRKLIEVAKLAEITGDSFKDIKNNTEIFILILLDKIKKNISQGKKPVDDPLFFDLIAKNYPDIVEIEPYLFSSFKSEKPDKKMEIYAELKWYLSYLYQAYLRQQDTFNRDDQLFIPIHIDSFFKREPALLEKKSKVEMDQNINSTAFLVAQLYQKGTYESLIRFLNEDTESTFDTAEIMGFDSVGLEHSLIVKDVSLEQFYERVDYLRITKKSIKNNEDHLYDFTYSAIEHYALLTGEYKNNAAKHAYLFLINELSDIQLEINNVNHTEQEKISALKERLNQLSQLEKAYARYIGATYLEFDLSLLEMQFNNKMHADFPALQEADMRNQLLMLHKERLSQKPHPDILDSLPGFTDYKSRYQAFINQLDLPEENAEEKPPMKMGFMMAPIYAIPGIIIGGAIGTLIFPGVGTAIGAAVGGLATGAGGWAVGIKLNKMALAPAAVTGTLIGFTIGSIFPGVGNIIGAGIGAAVGMAVGYGITKIPALKNERLQVTSMAISVLATIISAAVFQALIPIPGVGAAI